MGAALLGFGLKLLGFGQLVLGFILDIVKAIFQFALAKPFQFLTILLSLTLLWAGWYGYNVKQDLVATQKVVEEKVTFIKGQDKTIKEYVKALDTEKQNHVVDIKRSNDAVASIKRSADAALARAQKAGQEAKREQVKYDKLGSDYGRTNPSSGKPQDRIKREEATNDSFIKAWKEAAK